MDQDSGADVQTALDRVIKLEEEVEAPGHALVHAQGLEAAKASLHKWVDAMTGVVITPGLGRVTLVHPNGRYSTINSPDLPFAMSAPINARKRDEES